MHMPFDRPELLAPNQTLRRHARQLLQRAVRARQEATVTWGKFPAASAGEADARRHPYDV
jgi:hypothetical protein